MASLPFGGAGGDCLRGLSEAHVGINWSVPLSSTSCRRLGIESSSLRRCDNEGSPEQRWGLGISVKPLTWRKPIKGIKQCNRRRATVHSKESVSKYPMKPLYFSKNLHSNKFWMRIIAYLCLEPFDFSRQKYQKRKKATWKREKER